MRPLHHNASLSRTVFAVCTALYVLPLAFTRYFPGLDLPFHTLAIAAADGDFATVAVAPRGWSYLTFYAVAGALRDLGFGAAAACQIVIAAYVVAFVWTAARLLRTFGAHPALALLAAPAAYSVVLAYGFLPFAIAYPMTFALWAFVREAALVETPSPARWAMVLGAALLTALTHPLAAAFAGIGAAVIVAASADRRRLIQVGGTAAAVVVGMVPALIEIARLGGVEDPSLPPLLRDASLWERWTSAPRPPLGESLGQAPERLVWLAPAGARVWLVAALLAAAVAAIAVAGRAARRTSGLAAELLLAALVVIYLVSPYTLEAPFVIAIQPRLLPLIWIALLLVLRVEPRPRRPRALLVPLAAAGALGAGLFAVTMARFAGEAADFRAVAAAADDDAYTLALVEQPPAPDSAPATPWRAFPVHLMVERGGHVSHTFFGRGSWLPVRLADDAAVPRAPLPGQPRSFDWDTHAPGWSQILVRDGDPAAPHDYFGPHAAELELLERRGAWRLYRLRRPPARPRPTGRR